MSIGMSRIMHMPIKVGVRMYARYANCQTQKDLQIAEDCF